VLKFADMENVTATYNEITSLSPPKNGGATKKLKIDMEKYCTPTKQASPSLIVIFHHIHFVEKGIKISSKSV
jgi:hypothetical protein